MIASLNLVAVTAACNSNLGMLNDFRFNGASLDFPKTKLHFTLLSKTCLKNATAPYAIFDASANIWSCNIPFPNVSILNDHGTSMFSIFEICFFPRCPSCL